ncbi:hypothetical protein [Corynebacterium sp. zg254]|uniref:hypothetical protein n=1 Tax=Corynebacterium sp. zg254 TaxID=2656645 RepID=UPI0021513F36|nr:hypothetical protein [Corynebacterium sp. zg254]
MQKAVGGMSDDPEAESVVRDLMLAAEHTPLKRDVLMWRGVRNWQAVFGTEDLEELATYDEEQARFTAITTSREVAEGEFTTFGKAGALLRIKAKQGTKGVWMPANGDSSEELKRQQEFLVPPGARMKVTSVQGGKLPVIEVELSDE